MEIKKIVLTGGPGAGKSTAMQHIKDAFEKIGYRVITVPEVATEMIVGGVAPWTCGTNYDFQKQQLRLLLSTEDCFEQAVKTMPTKKVLILCDRGALDGKAYLDEEQYEKMLCELGLSEPLLQKRYAAVFHLVTPAKGLVGAYTTENNSARTESAEEAAEKDDKTLLAWAMHPKLKIIKNEPNFLDKINNLVYNIKRELNIGPPSEIERKFLIAMPNIEELERTCKRIDIAQTYLCTNGDEEKRVRKMSCGERTKYVFTKKRRITNETRVEEEKEISQEQYHKLLQKYGDGCVKIEKTRYKLMHKGKCFEIDVYPFWDNVATVEVELNDELESVCFPPQLGFVCEVTNNNEFKNANLAKSSVSERIEMLNVVNKEK